MQHTPTDAERSTQSRFARRWALPSLVVASAVAAELAGESGRATLRYQRDAILDGEWWRLISGNLVHLGPRHLVLNLAGFALVMALAGRVLEGWRGAAVVFASMFAVGAGMWWFAPEVAWYVGLSGALHGMLVCIALDALATREQRNWGLALLVVLAAKLGWERFAGPLPFTAAVAGGPVIVVAHLYGALGGGVATLASQLLARSLTSRGRANARV